MRMFQTRQDYIDALKELLLPLEEKYQRQQNGRICLGITGTTYTQKTSEIEAFLRPLWGLAPLLSGQEDEQLTEIYRGYLRGLINGTNPNHPAYWGHPKEDRQLIVEMAAIATAILLSKEKFWDVLSKSEQKNLHDWLILADECEIPNNNWHFFRILIHIAMRKCQQPFSQKQIERDFSAIESFYDAQGWYFDGREEKRDYYIAFAFQFYSLLYYKEMQTVDHKRCEKIYQRACQFAQSFCRYFDNQGRALPFGRSLTYRFAQVAFFAALVYANIEAIPWEDMKRLVDSHFTYWFNQAIFTENQQLTIGYGYANLVMAESYNGPGSPYWALKSFLLLAAPIDHPFWQATVKPIADNLGVDVRETIEPARMMLQSADKGEQVFGYPVGQWSLSQSHGISKYAKLVYSTQFGFSVSKSSVGYSEGGYDSTLAVSLDNRYFITKEEVSSYQLLKDRTIQIWHPFSGVSIQTTVIPLGEYHIRIHEVQNTMPLYVYDGGFSVNQEVNFKERHHPAIISYQSAQGKITCQNIQGYEEALLIANMPNTNVLYPRTAMVALRGYLNPGNHRLVSLFSGQIHPQPAPMIQLDENELSIDFCGKKQFFKLKI
ncbi:MAG: DUF2264 domain-containing protein [Enterococcus cecorum]|nr:DUF2264 domain-containing protein [Enterococcus cecorum]CAI3465476.1 hypothetical protein CIRMBP1204_02197 [Enterococcus cecorum]